MTGRAAYRDRGRTGRGRDEARRDVVITAVTLQTLICVLLLVVAFFAKKANETGYYDVKTQYDKLVTDPAEGAQVFAEVTGGSDLLQAAFASIEGAVASLLERFDKDAPVVTEAEDLDEPAPLPEPAETALFDYNYLSKVQAVAAGFGQGGPIPETRSVGSETPPPDASFNRVELIGRIVPPVTGLVTSEFAYRRHPVSGGADFHTGLDIAAVEGADIYAILPGTVTEVGQDASYGKYIRVQHSANLQTFYGHCSAIIAKEGMTVRQGERIAQVGQTGVATGPHLHFSVLVDGKYTDPYWVLRDNIKLVN